ncbi:PH domain-containing protein [Micromonospora purpureochromogenes]|uniref:PH domain-containing protein n=1 Tax=Micromonospora purpureochromogenes TaxID=47872 RepID=A0A1C4WWA8_9ACTN|nr:PH domain-containing protein [Micromonospora purpureochromogenes]SCF00453.1 PH domain-containing protein [Micromonospora purpureochromogenes]
MTPRTARLLALPFALAATLLRIGVEFWLKPFAWRLESGAVSSLVWAAGTAGSILAPAAGYLLLTRAVRRRPATFRVDPAGRHFTAPAAPAWAGPWSIIVSWLAGGLLLTERVPGEDRVRFFESGDALVWNVLAVLAVLVFVVLVLLDARPRLTLDETGITVRGLVRRRTVRWDRLLPGGPPAPAGKAAGTLVLSEQPSTPAGRPVSRSLAVGRAHVDGAFLAGSVRHYVAHPERRSAIGTAPELASLGATVSGAPDA